MYPGEIVGKRTRVRLDGKRQIKIHLDHQQKVNLETKVLLSYTFPTFLISVSLLGWSVLSDLQKTDWKGSCV